jgi:TonB family protein
VFRFASFLISAVFHISVLLYFSTDVFVPMATAEVSMTILEIEPVKDRPLNRMARPETRFSPQKPVTPQKTVQHSTETSAQSPQESPLIPVAEYKVTQMPRLLNEVRVPYPENARKSRIEGTVLLDFIVDSEGTVRSIEAIEGPSDDLKSAAIQAARGFKFEPALVHDKPVTVKIRYAYRFVLGQ